MAQIETAWQQRGSWTVLLLPLALLFRAISWLRKQAFNMGLKSSYRASVPVIVVGNITVGGSGKTPTVLWLCQLLKQAGYQPAVISRGYGGKANQYPLQVMPNTAVAESGDEPLLIALRSGCPVIVDPIRAQAAQRAEALGCDVIITDDGLQHYALQRDIELVVIDGERRFGNGLPLPSGPLREPISRLNSVFACICNGGKAQASEWQMHLQPEAYWSRVQDQSQVQASHFVNKKVLAIAGIGNPQRFFQLINCLGIAAEHLALADHAALSQSELDRWQQQYDVILMTEKDAVKCRHLSLENGFYLPVTAELAEQHSAALLAELARVSVR